MSTAQQVKAFLGPFLQRHPELALIKRELIRVPIQHCVVGVAFARPHYRGEIDLRWFVSFLFAPPPLSRGGFGGRMDRAWGYLNDPELPDRVFIQMELVFQNIIPTDTALDNALEVHKRTPRYFGEMTPESRALLLTALGRFSEAELVLQDEVRRQRKNIAFDLRPGGVLERKPSLQKSHDAWKSRIDNLDKLLKLLHQGTSTEVAALLHEWEAIALANRSLRRYWEPAPFPFEAT